MSSNVVSDHIMSFNSECPSQARWPLFLGVKGSISFVSKVRSSESNGQKLSVCFSVCNVIDPESAMQHVTSWWDFSPDSSPPNA